MLSTTNWIFGLGLPGQNQNELIAAAGLYHLSAECGGSAFLPWLVECPCSFSCLCHQLRLPLTLLLLLLLLLSPWPLVRITQAGIGECYRPGTPIGLSLSPQHLFPAAGQVCFWPLFYHILFWVMVHSDGILLSPLKSGLFSRPKISVSGGNVGRPVVIAVCVVSSIYRLPGWMCLFLQIQTLKPSWR